MCSAPSLLKILMDFFRYGGARRCRPHYSLPQRPECGLNGRAKWLYLPGRRGIWTTRNLEGQQTSPSI